MPIYQYKCKEHGLFDEWQNINAEHTCKCHQCDKKADRVFTPLPLHGDLPSKPCNIGKTRAEVFDNLAGDGLAAKDWRQSDEYSNKEWRDAGIKEKPMVGWTPELG
jgi:putative FmdB family regulatory protein